MTDHDVETFVRDTFRDHERLADGAGARLLPAVRLRTRRRGLRRLAGTALTALAVLLGTAVTLSLAPAGAPSPSPSPTVSQGTVPAGWRVESSIGLEVAVPADWVLDNYGCGMTGASTVVRHGLESPLLCSSPEPPGKEIAAIERVSADGGAGPLPLYGGIAERALSLGGTPARRAEGLLRDGRSAGWVHVPDRGLAVVVKTRDPAVTRQILDSVRLVGTVDHAGCELRQPAPAPGPGTAGATFVTPAPTAVSICYYAGSDGSLPMVMQASARIGGEDARHLAEVLNAAAPGPNPDAPAGECMETHPPAADVVLHLWAGDEVVDSVWVTYGTCTQRGLSNGAERAQMTHTLLRLIRDHVHAGYYLRADIPQ